MPVVSGDFSGLKQLATAMGSFGDPPTRRELASVLGEEARTQALIGFQRGVDPYDRPWKPLVSRVGQPLQDSGRLRNSVSGKAAVAVTDRGFTISTDVLYAAVHQYGATIRAKNKPYLRFRVGGARPRGHGRGATGGWVSKKVVTIPQRQFMPEEHLGARWEKGLEDQADAFVQQRLGGRP